MAVLAQRSSEAEDSSDAPPAAPNQTEEPEVRRWRWWPGTKRTGQKGEQKILDNIMLKASLKMHQRCQTCPRRCGTLCWSRRRAPIQRTCRNRRRRARKGHGKEGRGHTRGPLFVWAYLGLIRSLQGRATRCAREQRISSRAVGLDRNPFCQPNTATRSDSAGWTKRTQQSSRESR